MANISIYQDTLTNIRLVDHISYRCYSSDRSKRYFHHLRASLFSHICQRQISTRALNRRPAEDILAFPLCVASPPWPVFRSSLCTACTRLQLMLLPVKHLLLLGNLQVHILLCSRWPCYKFGIAYLLEIYKHYFFQTIQQKRISINKNFNLKRIFIDFIWAITFMVSYLSVCPLVA